MQRSGGKLIGFHFLSVGSSMELVDIFLKHGQRQWPLFAKSTWTSFSRFCSVKLAVQSLSLISPICSSLYSPFRWYAPSAARCTVLFVDMPHLQLAVQSLSLISPICSSLYSPFRWYAPSAARCTVPSVDMPHLQLVVSCVDMPHLQLVVQSLPLICPICSSLYSPFHWCALFADRCKSISLMCPIPFVAH